MREAGMISRPLFSPPRGTLSGLRSRECAALLLSYRDRFLRLNVDARRAHS
jgi:hypothetical protein